MHVIGTSQKDEALKYLPKGTKCFSVYACGSSQFVVDLPTGQRIAIARSSLRAWYKAKEWWLENHVNDFSQLSNAKKKVYQKK